MPPLPLLPNQPVGVPDWRTPTGPQYAPGANPYAPMAPPRSPINTSAIASQYPNLPQSLPGLYAEEGWSENRIRATMEYLDAQRQALQSASGWERTKLEAQIKDTEKQLANAYRIAEIQAQTSRYGTDQQTRVELAQLQESQRQFDANHGVEMQKLGLDVAKTYTQFAQTYDDLFALQDLKGAVSAVSQGRMPPQMSSYGTPHAKNYDDFYALTGYGQMPGGGGAPPGGGGSGAGSDPRMTAINSVAKALPPSGAPGHDPQDWAAINAITSLYFGAKPGAVEKLGAERQKAAQGALARAGYNPRLVDEERRRSLPGQGRPNAA